MMIYDDFRRCRRCKRRRMDDEPPEVQQYKTCAKCRIIERTKKKLRKPLAEETMRYGMRQFQEQNQSTDFMGDDLFANDSVLPDDSTPGDSVVGSPLMYQSQYQISYDMQSSGMPTANSGEYNYSHTTGPQQMSQSTAGPAFRKNPDINGYPAVPDAHQSPPHPSSNPAHPRAQALSYGSAPVSAGKPRNEHVQPVMIKDTYKLRLRIQKPRLVAVSHCELCGSSVDPEDRVSSIFRLCGSCYADPYEQPMVYKDYNDFLLKAVHDEEYLSYTFVSEIPSASVESLLTGRTINSEEQFRKVLMEALAVVYMDPLLALLAPLKFGRFSLNVPEVNNTQPVVLQHSQQLHYNFTPLLRAAYGANSNSEKTRIEMTFVPEASLMIIKKKTQTVSPSYTTSFLRQLDEQWRNSSLTFDSSPPEVYSRLNITISRELFLRDYSVIVSQIKALREKDVRNGSQPVSGITRVSASKSAPEDLNSDFEDVKDDSDSDDDDE